MTTEHATVKGCPVGPFDFYSMRSQQSHNPSLVLLLGQSALWKIRVNSAKYAQRPDLLAPAMEVTLNTEAIVEPGYVFITPYQQPQAGPYIYDKKGVSGLDKCDCSGI